VAAAAAAGSARGTDGRDNSSSDNSEVDSPVTIDGARIADDGSNSLSEIAAGGGQLSNREQRSDGEVDDCEQSVGELSIQKKSGRLPTAATLRGTETEWTTF